MFVIIGELGFNVIGAAGQHPFRCLLNGGDELILLLGSGAVAPNHVLCFVDCRFEKGRKQKPVLGAGVVRSKATQRSNRSRSKRNGEM